MDATGRTAFKQQREAIRAGEEARRRGGEEVSEPTVTHSEWYQDLDRASMVWPQAEGSASTLATKGRCMTCWGALDARGDSTRGCTSIRCRVCGAVVRCRAAGDEWQRMDEDRFANLLRMDLGSAAIYGAGRFVYKVFLDVDRLSAAQVASRVAARGPRDKRDWITRADFPVGSAGRLAFQARALLAGIDHSAVWEHQAFVGFTEFVTRDDGSQIVPGAPVLAADSDLDKEGRVLRWMGSIMNAATHSAFACELALKAIALTCNDEAHKTHDLLVLLDDLPDTSRRRLQADQQEIASLLKRKRETFGKWRYFETDLPQGGINALIDVAAARDLGRAARVLLDEAEIVGLRAGFTFNGTRTTEVTDNRSRRRDRFELRLTSDENPPAPS